jgi:hypothetical protein
MPLWAVILLLGVAFVSMLAANWNDISHLIGTANDQEKAAGRANEQMNGRLADQKTIN